MSDRKIIYLDDALDEVNLMTDINGFCDGYAVSRKGVCITLKQLPPAQPDRDEWCTDCKEYDQERRSCPRWNRVIRETLKDAQSEHSVAQERYEDLCEYFGNDHDAIKTVLGDRKEFKAWLERLKWHVKECNKLSRQLEAQPEIIHCKDCVHHIDGFFCRQANHHTSDSDHCASVFRAERREE